MNYPGDVTEKGSRTSAEVTRKNARSRTRSPHTAAGFGVLTKVQGRILTFCVFLLDRKTAIFVFFSYCRIEEKEQSTRKNTNDQPAAVLVTALAA